MQVADAKLAEQLTRLLQSDIAACDKVKLELIFETARVGRLKLQVPEEEQKAYAVTLHALPTVVETFKSHNHINLVKSADVGQVILLHYDENFTTETMVQSLIDVEASGNLPMEHADGITVPMADARNRVFRKQFNVEPELVEQVESHMIALMNGEAPDGWVIEDVAEVYVTDAKTGQGKWMPVSSAPAAVTKKGDKAGKS